MVAANFEMKAMAQKQILVIPIIDASGGMAGEKIARINEAMREMVFQLVDIEQNDNVEILLAPIVFNNGARWMVNEPVRPGNFNWYDVQASGGADLGAAYYLLIEKLRRRENGGWINARERFRPILLLISDGKPSMGWESNLDELKKRGWFKVALRYAIAIEEANLPVLEAFTGTSEAIFDIETFCSDLQWIVQPVWAVDDDAAEIDYDATVVTGDGPNSAFVETVATDELDDTIGEGDDSFFV